MDLFAMLLEKTFFLLYGSSYHIKYEHLKGDKWIGWSIFIPLTDITLHGVFIARQDISCIGLWGVDHTFKPSDYIVLIFGIDLIEHSRGGLNCTLNMLDKFNVCHYNMNKVNIQLSWVLDKNKPLIDNVWRPSFQIGCVAIYFLLYYALNLSF